MVIMVAVSYLTTDIFAHSEDVATKKWLRYSPLPNTRSIREFVKSKKPIYLPNLDNTFKLVSGCEF